MRMSSFRLLSLGLGLAGTLLVLGCRRPAPEPAAARTRPQPSHAATALGFTIQAGAFSKVENAARLSERLREEGLEATWFAAPDGLFKVRFGDFPDRASARRRAEALQARGTIEAFYVVAPEPRLAATRSPGDDEALRRDLVKTAEGFLGLPYLWGGTSAETGFDCSGLAMAVYRLNGLRLPRSSREQFEEGVSIPREDLRRGDLLFFATSGGGKASHVAVYVGEGTFIHAPGRGRSICRDTLANPILARQYLGARSYI